MTIDNDKLKLTKNKDNVIIIKLIQVKTNNFSIKLKLGSKVEN